MYFFNIVENFFESFSLHFTTEDLRAVLAKKWKTFLIIFLFTLTTGDQLPVWLNTVEFFLSSLTTGHEMCVWSQILKILSVTPIRRWEKRFEEGFRNYVLALPNGHEKCVWAKKSETLFKNFCSHSLLEARCPSGPLFGKFFFLTYMGKMSTPSLPLPTGGKAAV